MKILKTIDIPFLGKKEQGKVRDIYKKNGQRILITTDRISAFDRVLGFIPHKGQVLNQLSAFWFAETADIVANHLEAVPDPNVMVVKECQPIPIEIVVRGYITGVTKTSLWYLYSQGKRQLYGHHFPHGLKKNQKLPKPILTPTTRATAVGGHDEPIDKKTIIQRKIMSPVLYELVEKTALTLFERSTTVCARGGLILVDTKYEFGFSQGKLTLIDEIHTPDSSRFWVKESYQKRFNKGLEPENFDKEFFRLWYAKRNYIGEGEPPKLSNSFIKKVSQRYIACFEKIIGKPFIPAQSSIKARIINHLKQYFAEVVIIAGSPKDQSHVEQISQALKDLELTFTVYFASAHKQPKKVLEILDCYKNRKLVYITVAGRSNALSGFVAANCSSPVIACPPFADKLDYLVNIHSTLQMPSEVPVMTVIDPTNAALAAARIIKTQIEGR